MAQLIFEELMPAYSIRGNAEAILHETPMQGNNLNVQTDQAFHVHFNWTQQGWLSRFLTGRFTCQLFFEEMGAGESGAAPSVTTNFIQSDPADYNVVINVPRGTLSAGLYRVVARVTFANNAGVPGAIAAFCDLGFLNMYDAVP